MWGTLSTNRRENSRRQPLALHRGRKSKRSLILAETIWFKRLIKRIIYQLLTINIVVSSQDRTKMSMIRSWMTKRSFEVILVRWTRARSSRLRTPSRIQCANLTRSGQAAAIPSWTTALTRTLKTHMNTKMTTCSRCRRLEIKRKGPNNSIRWCQLSLRINQVLKKQEEVSKWLNRNKEVHAVMRAVYCSEDVFLY